MPKRRLIIPPADDRICSFDGWELFDRSHIEIPQHEPVGMASPLWLSLKAVHIARKGKGGRGTGRRAYWLRYGVVAGRFRRGGDAFEFYTRFPAVYAAFEAKCRTFHTVAKWKHRLGAERFAQEVAKLEQSTAKRLVHEAERREAAHAAALEEDDQWRLLYE